MKLSARGRKEIARVKVGEVLLVLCSQTFGKATNYEILRRNTRLDSTYGRFRDYSNNHLVTTEVQARAELAACAKLIDDPLYNVVCDPCHRTVGRQL